ncbi:hypothetical protein CHELA1G11_11221 [Hyphomicrobiales bacterium]|nr:hypothetical protein CHELA1G11_11221 [Hyphomicrobiales bacterium]
MCNMSHFGTRVLPRYPHPCAAAAALNFSSFSQISEVRTWVFHVESWPGSSGCRRPASERR